MSRSCQVRSPVRRASRAALAMRLERSISITVLVALFLVSAVSVDAATKVVGTMTAPPVFTTALPIVGYEWTTEATGGGAPSFSPFKIVRVADSLSPTFFDLAANRPSIPSVTIEITQSRGVATFVLTDAKVVRRTRESGPRGEPLESVSFSYATIRETVTTKDGSTTFCWNLTQVSSCPP